MLCKDSKLLALSIPTLELLNAMENTEYQPGKINLALLCSALTPAHLHQQHWEEES